MPTTEYTVTGFNEAAGIEPQKRVVYTKTEAIEILNLWERAGLTVVIDERELFGGSGLCS